MATHESDGNLKGQYFKPLSMLDLNVHDQITELLRQEGFHPSLSHPHLDILGQGSTGGYLKIFSDLEIISYPNTGRQSRGAEPL